MHRTDASRPMHRHRLALRTSWTHMLELAVLGLLEENDLHGYELRKRLGDLLGLRLAISFGSLYPALGRLEKAGLVKAVSNRPTPPSRSAPMSGSLAGELAAFRAQRRAGVRWQPGHPRQEGVRHHRCRAAAPRRDAVRPRRVRRPRLPGAGRLLPQPAAGGPARPVRAPAGRACSPEPTRAAAPTAATAGSTPTCARCSSATRRPSTADLAWLDRLIADERAAGHLVTRRPPPTRSHPLISPPAGRRRPTPTFGGTP